MGRNIPSLIETLRFSDEQSREQAAERLEQIGRQAVPSLLELLGDESSRVRWRAVWALEEIADPMSIPGLLTTLSDRDERVRIGAISALKRIGGEQALNGVTRTLGDPAWSVRREAARALGEMGDEVAIPYLLDILQQDDDWAVRRVAAVSLGQLGDQRATNGLLATLHDQNVAVRVAAARSLGQIGDKSILPDLKRLLSQQLDNDTRRALEHTLEKLDPVSMVKLDPASVVKLNPASVVKLQPKPQIKKQKSSILTDPKWQRKRIEIGVIIGIFTCILCLALVPILGATASSPGQLPTQEVEQELSSRELYNRATDHFDGGRYYSALKDLNEAIEFDQSSPEIYNLRGRVYKRLRDDFTALDDFKHAITLDPNYADPYYYRALIYDDWKAEGPALTNYLNYLELAQDTVDNQRHIEHARKRVEALGSELPD